LGITPVAIVLLWITFIPGWQIGLRASLICIGITGVEHAIKIKIQRNRPFIELPKIAMHQPDQPHDYAYPSGDAMRVW